MEKAELFWLRRFLKSIRTSRLQKLKILSLPVADLYGKTWSVTGKNAPGARSKDQAVYLAGRNILFLSKAATFAALNGIGIIEIGVLKGNPFSDSTARFFRKMSEVLSLGLSHRVEVRAPFKKLNKAQVIHRFQHVPFHLTFSCLKPRGTRPCGRCNKCTERHLAFASLNSNRVNHRDLVSKGLIRLSL